MQRVDAILTSVYQKTKSLERYRASFYDGPHKFDRDMQKEAFDWFDRWLKGQPREHAAALTAASHRRQGRAHTATEGNARKENAGQTPGALSGNIGSCGTPFLRKIAGEVLADTHDLRGPY
jgi:hypothetical protein